MTVAVSARSVSGLPLRVSRASLQRLDSSMLKQAPLCLALSSADQRARSSPSLPTWLYL